MLIQDVGSVLPNIRYSWQTFFSEFQKIKINFENEFCVFVLLNVHNNFDITFFLAVINVFELREREREKCHKTKSNNFDLNNNRNFLSCLKCKSHWSVKVVNYNWCCAAGFTAECVLFKLFFFLSFFLHSTCVSKQQRAMLNAPFTILAVRITGLGVLGN